MLAILAPKKILLSVLSSGNVRGVCEFTLECWSVRTSVDLRRRDEGNSSALYQLKFNVGMLHAVKDHFR